MARSLKALIGVVPVLALALLTLPAPAAQAGDESFHVVVTGGGNDADAKKRLTQFARALQNQVRPLSLSEAYIECQNCKALDVPGSVVKELHLWIWQDFAEEALTQIGTAHAKVYARNPSNKFGFTVDDRAPPDPDCGGFLAPCNPRPICASMAGCSEQAYPKPCKICDGNPGMAGCEDAGAAAPARKMSSVPE